MDDRGVEIAYAVLVFVAWVWALSQVRQVVQTRSWRWPFPWRTTAALWMTTSAAFFTYVGSVWWFDQFSYDAHQIAIYTLSTVYVIAFVHWIRLPQEKAPHPSLPPKSNGTDDITGVSP